MIESDIYYSDIENYYLGDIERNDAAHNLEHVREVLERMLSMRKKLFPDNSEVDKLIPLAAYIHDLKCHIDRKNHHLLSAEYIRVNRKLDPFLKELSMEEIMILIDAIESHRASDKRDKKTILSKLLYAADKDEPNLIVIFNRAYSYDPSRPIEKIIEHMKDKFSKNGYLEYDDTYINFYGQSSIDDLHHDVDYLIRHPKSAERILY